MFQMLKNMLLEGDTHLRTHNICNYSMNSRCQPLVLRVNSILELKIKVGTEIRSVFLIGHGFHGIG